MTFTFESSMQHWNAIQRIHSRYSKEVNDVLKPKGLSKSQFDLLMTLYHQESATQKSLERTLELSSGAISQTVKKLLAEHLIIRKRINREKRILLTEDGAALIQTSAPEIEEIDDRYFRAFTSKDHETFDQLLHKMQSDHF
ncbi:MarR family winged helix-turn-helix transcriptional regulator [Exiguobacterium sp. UBA4551]|uniref:MarR family winged helix-turn-helix transcriptional regulator n=1 Tax=Exiguobacterium sp. UBA4551 TaxID=1946494 RepID=UPI0025795F88|nr:MarR family transcriptional regulator [Exiguobacterium sp. UBA4551]